MWGLHGTRSPAGRRSVILLWWIPASPLIGFAIAGRLLSETWPLRQVIPLTVALAAPFAAGAYFGLQAIRRGDRRGWITLPLHLAFSILAIVMPISEPLTA